jgi:intracellular septation protein
MNQWIRLALETGPLVVFFVGNIKFGIMPATGAFMVATMASLAVNYALERRLPVMPLVAGAFIIVFGALTLAFEDSTFIKLKPTVVNLLFAGALFSGLALRRNLLKIVFQAAFHLDEDGWRLLTWRWAFFFVFLALVNELVWRTQTTDFWVSFKLFGIMPLTVVFGVCQVPLILRHQIKDPEGGA